MIVQVPYILKYSNDNLLKNWYFIGGGSQQGGGQFPINYLGLTEYTGVGYTIDRWKLYGPGALELAADGIVLKTTTANAVLGQPVSGASDLIGKQVTLSFIADPIQNPGGFQICFFKSNSYNTGILPTTVNDSGTGQKLYTVTFVPQAGFYGISFYVYRNAAQSSEIKLYAAKLELGPIQTLAHQDADGNWVLNDPPPKFGAELGECQYYQSVIRAQSGNVTLGTGVLNSDKRIAIPLPIGPLRISPSTIDNPAGLVASTGTFNSNSLPITKIEFIGYRPGDKIVTALFSCPTGTVGQIYRVGLLAGNKLIIDSNL